MEHGLTAQQQKHMKKVIEQIAKQNGVTPTEVRQDIAEMISVTLREADPTTRAQWDACPCAGETPTPEEFLFWVGSLTKRGIKQSLVLPDAAQWLDAEG